MNNNRIEKKIRRAEDAWGESEEGTPTYPSQVIDREWGGMRRE